MKRPPAELLYWRVPNSARGERCWVGSACISLPGVQAIGEPSVLLSEANLPFGRGARQSRIFGKRGVMMPQ